MKRREFLSTTVSLSGGLLLPFSRTAHAAPCPPNVLTVHGGVDGVTACGGPTTAPKWFANAPDGQWVEIARHSEGKSVRSVAPSPIPTNAVDLEGFESIPNCYGGGVVDQARGELLLPQRGGHTNYCGNECYALNVRSEDPRWYRLIDPTPSSSIPNLQSDNGSSYASGVYSDGRMRSVHGWSRVVFANNRVIHPTLDSVFSAGGDGPRRGFAYNRAYPGTPIAPGGSALPWQNNVGPFEDLGAPPNTGDGANYSKGPAVYQRNTGTVWTFCGGSYGLGWKINSKTMEYAGTFSASTSNAINPYTSWCLDLFDKGVFLMSMPYQGGTWGGTGVAVFDPSNPSTGWYRKNPANSFGAWMTSGFAHTRYGAAYDSASSKVYCYVRSSPGSIHVLDVPADPIASGNWAWRTVNPGGIVPSGFRGESTYGNFGIIESMGSIDGVVRQALVLFTKVDGPTYAMKVPLAGL